MALIKQAFLFFFLVMAVPLSANAASLLFSQPTSNCSIGADCKVSVRVSTDQAVNAASGVVMFPNDKFEVRSISKSPSIFNLWVQEPSFSNQRGTVSFEGIILNPGFTGSGTILSITFRPKTAGTASLSFSEGQILANDGAATNILTFLGVAQFTLNGAKPKPTVSEIVDSQDDISTSTEATTTIAETAPTFSPAPETVPASQGRVFTERNLLIMTTILFSLVLALLVWVLWHIRRNNLHGHGSLQREVREAQSVLHRAFDLLREDLVDRMHDLEKARTKRRLTIEEEKILKQFRRNLDEAETAIRKEIQDIIQ